MEATAAFDSNNLTVGPSVVFKVANTPIRDDELIAFSVIASSILIIGIGIIFLASVATSPTEEHVLKIISAPASIAQK